MSFSVSLKAEGGQVEVTGVHGTVPDGTITVSGHTDETHNSLGVSIEAPAKVVS